MILLGVHQASALLEYQTPLELYNNHELIVIGKVISLTEISNRETIYNVKVEEYLKNPKPYDLIDAYGLGAKNSGMASSIDTIFEIGDRVLLYLNKENEKYKISPYSFKAPLACGKHQLLQLATIPGEPRSISSPATNLIHLPNTFGAERETFVVNERINMDYNLINNNPRSNNIELEIAIMTDSAKVFHANQSMSLEPCTQTTISWHFTPTKTGEYTVNVTSDGISTSTDFHVRLNTAGGSLDKTASLSPLKQFKNDFDFKKIKCGDSLQLIFKTTNGLPACVKPSSIERLSELGWGKISQHPPNHVKLDIIKPETIIMGKNQTKEIQVMVPAFFVTDIRSMALDHISFQDSQSKETMSPINFNENERAVEVRIEDFIFPEDYSRNKIVLTVFASNETRKGTYTVELLLFDGDINLTDSFKILVQ